MTIVIAIFILLAFILIAATPKTSVNKAALAVFASTVGWVLYICFGSDFVMAQHPTDYMSFLRGATANSVAVKEYIASNIFIKYVGKASEIVLFLMSTMTIIEILDTNGCFDFFPHWIKTRNSKRLLWSVAVLTFLLSANMDNLTVTTMMLVMMHKMLPNRRQRTIFGPVIVLSANIGGALTVIGDPNGLLLWNMGAVTPSHFSAWMALPCLVAWAVPTFLMSLKLPERVELERFSLPYRGDDTRLTVWQRVAMFFFGIGGLWFIPTFRDITKLSPFVGALCVLALLSIVNETFNHKLIVNSRMTQRNSSRTMHNGMLQMMLFIMGVMLMMGVLVETGASLWLGKLCLDTLGDTWSLFLAPLMAAVVSLALDSFATAAAFLSLHPIGGTAEFMTNGEYWILIAYATAVGGTIFGIGSLSGLALFSMNTTTVGWYFKHFAPKMLLGALLGLLVLIAEALYF
ncbi:sodium:proton antiporter [Palleniella muris]|uniref:Sodium:proton antiporter n=2 Tax=Palleniella muris TaxID=3038145 RepID=A0AC61QPV7_9BACT|nr:sodium:proton antiporter [Palleniella muris]